MKDETCKQFTHVMTVTNRGSNQVILNPCWWKDKAPVVTSQFLHEVVRHRGLLSSIVSDMDTKFTGVFRIYLCNLMEVKTRMTSPFHAQANGAAERISQTMEQTMKNEKVLRTVVLAKQQQPNVGPIPN